MAVAKIYPDPERGGRGNKGYCDNTVSKQRLSHARTVLRFAADLADAVMAGTKSLDEAYAAAQAAKAASESRGRRGREECRGRQGLSV